MVLGGRGAGKTRTGVEYVLNHLRELGPKARVGIGAPTIADARDTCAEGESGLITLYRNEFTMGGKLRYNRSIGEAYHRDGGYVRFLGSEEPNRWNGPQWTALWADELALWNWDSWEMAQFGLRLGEHPRAIATTTPKTRAKVRALVADPGTATTHATLHDNPYTSPVFRRRIENTYGGTRLGRQEIGGEFVDDIEGAAWQRAWIEQSRVAAAPPLQRVVIAVDPEATSKPGSDFTGIAAAGRDLRGDYYVLHAFGYRLAPMAWAARAVDLYDEHRADRIVAEVNNGGEMVISNIATVPHRGTVPVRAIHASRGKLVRAEPVISLYEQGKVHHVGVLSEAEDQMCSWPVQAEHDDMVDAIVYAITELNTTQVNTWRGQPGNLRERETSARWARNGQPLGR